jgi:hypothetical protein
VLDNDIDANLKTVKLFFSVTHNEVEIIGIRQLIGAYFLWAGGVLSIS